MDGPRFIEVAKEATKKKPVIILKSGVSAAGAKAASSHTGALAGSDTAYETAFRRAGVLRASTMTELFDLASAFTTQPIPKGKRVAVITNSGGPGIVASDAIELGGLEMAQFSQNTLEFLKETMPSMANIQNPIDVIGDAHYDRYENALNAALADPNVDAATVLLSPTAVIGSRQSGRSNRRGKEEVSGQADNCCFHRRVCGRERCQLPAGARCTHIRIP